MAPLHFPLPHTVICRGRRYRLRPAFDRVLKVIALWKEEELTESDKLELSLRSLVRGHVHGDTGAKVELLNTVFDTLIDGGQSTRENSTPAFDFIQDAGYIYSSFLMDYGLDLYEEQGRLHWWKFLQLFRGLSDRTKIVQVMQIRSRPMPEPTKYNAEERKQLARLKAEYALHFTEAERERHFATGLKHLAATLEGMAKE